MATHALDGPWTLRLWGRPRGAVPQVRQLLKGVPARVPGTVHVALQQAGIVADPFQGREELAQQWIDEQDWVLEREVVLAPEDCACARRQLLFDGIDTIAEVRWDARTLARSANMFRAVACELPADVRPGRHRLRVIIRSPTRWARAAAARMGGQPREDAFRWQTGESRGTWRTAIRKTQCHFGWDWGTYLATSGIWQRARLHCSDAPRITAVRTTQAHHGPVGAPRRVDLSVSVALEGARAGRGEVVGVLMGGPMPRDDRRERRVISASSPVRLARGASEATLSFAIEDPILWWPAHEGAQYLYYLSVHCQDERGNRTPDTLVQVGLRTIAVETPDGRAPDGKPAQGLRFVVNGRPIWAKGANWIPPDQFVERCTAGVYRHLLESMVDAHMNMVRVWGGGWYEQEAFYDLCDELGILVWQDAMMACGFYPDHRAFLAELDAEVRHQVRRLSRRTCIALWCGDNEDNTGVAHWWRDAGTLASRLARYRRTIGVVARAVAAEDPTRRFWPSSPCSGAISAHPDDPNRGDVHYWAVWHGRQPFSNYLSVRPRFVSEFGFQSFPESRTLAACVPAAELNPSSRVMEHHQRSNDGNLLITNTMAREMRIPKDFDAFCWVSQINQAMAIRTAVEHWRRLKPWCMGTIYWQLNDLWPVASWSSIDWHGRWKVLQHAAKRFFAPLLPSLAVAGGALEAWATSDIDAPLALAATLRVVALDGRTVATRRWRMRLRAQESRRLARLELSELLPRGIEAHTALCFLRLDAARADGAAISAENYAPLVPWKWLALEAPRVSHRLAAEDGALALTVRPRTVVPFFHAELHGLEGRFDGDWDVLRPERDYRLTWVPHRARGARQPTLAEARKRLRTMSLWDTYAHPEERGRRD